MWEPNVILRHTWIYMHTYLSLVILFTNNNFVSYVLSCSFLSQSNWDSAQYNVPCLVLYCRCVDTTVRSFLVHMAREINKMTFMLHTWSKPPKEPSYLTFSCLYMYIVLNCCISFWLGSFFMSWSISSAMCFGRMDRSKRSWRGQRYTQRGQDTHLLKENHFLKSHKDLLVLLIRVWFINTYMYSRLADHSNKKIDQHFGEK